MNQVSCGALCHTKIVATVGPATANADSMTDLLQAGVDVFRINTAHGSREDHLRTLELARNVSNKLGRTVGVLVDLAGPKIRLGELPAEPISCRFGEEFTFVRGKKSPGPNELVSGYEKLIDELSDGDRVMLADGTVSMRVIEKHSDRVRCQVTSPGTIRSRQGINLPGVRLSLPTLSDRDQDNAHWAAEHEVDFLGISFVRAANDLTQLRRQLAERHNDPPWLIAKIEKPEALEQLDAIVRAADGVMIARGDLGVETDVAELAVVQKRIVTLCNRLRRPVIVATQMLDSMQHSTQPTRAEATDVANAILDGTDACMLSGETAVGDYPVESVQMMRRIIKSTEQLYEKREAAKRTDAPTEVHPLTEAVVSGASRIACNLDAQLVVVATRSGATALVQASQRDLIPTIAFTDHAPVLRRLNLVWGITPVADAPLEDPARLWSFVEAWGRERQLLDQGSRVVLVAGTGFDADAHNSVVVYEVE